MPKPTCPLLGSQDRSVTLSERWLVAISRTVSGRRRRMLSSTLPLTSMRAKRM
jgi:hypothetical protein